jgi:hypothetical protein
MRAFNLGLSIAFTAMSVLAADEQFRPPAMADLKSQTTAGITIGAKAYYSATEVKQAFGKVDPVKYGVLPVFIAIENKSDKSITLSGMKAVYVDIDKDRVEAMPVSEVKYANGPSKPNINNSPIPYPRKVKLKKNPLNDRVIEERGFAAKILPPGDSARGFLYFDVIHRGGTTLLISGLKESASGQELFYFEMVLE